MKAKKDEKVGRNSVEINVLFLIPFSTIRENYNHV